MIKSVALNANELSMNLVSALHMLVDMKKLIAGIFVFSVVAQSSFAQPAPVARSESNLETLNKSLYEAVRQGRYDDAKKMLEYGANSNYIDTFDGAYGQKVQKSPVVYEAVEKVRKAREDVRFPDAYLGNDTKYFLKSLEESRKKHEAEAASAEQFLELLVLKYGADLNAKFWHHDFGRDNEVSTVEVVAAIGDFGLMQYLENKFGLRYKGYYVSEKTFDTVLHLIAKAGDKYEDGLRYHVIERRETVDSLNIERRTPLMIAAYSCHFGIVKALMQFGANAKLKDKEGKTAADYAAMGAEYEERQATRYAEIASAKKRHEKQRDFCRFVERFISQF